MISVWISKSFVHPHPGRFPSTTHCNLLGGGSASVYFPQNTKFNNLVAEPQGHSLKPGLPMPKPFSKWSGVTFSTVIWQIRMPCGKASHVFPPHEIARNQTPRYIWNSAFKSHPATFQIWPLMSLWTQTGKQKAAGRNKRVRKENLRKKLAG